MSEEEQILYSMSDCELVLYHQIGGTIPTLLKHRLAIALDQANTEIAPAAKQSKTKPNLMKARKRDLDRIYFDLLNTIRDYRSRRDAARAEHPKEQKRRKRAA